MALTVKKALEGGPLNGCHLLAGHRGVERIIEGVGVLEAPDSVEWLRGGELVLTIGYFLEREPETTLVKLLHVLSDKRAAAFAIKLKRYIQTLTPIVLATADELSIPLIEIPFEWTWYDVIKPLLSALVSQQADLLEHSRRLNELLTKSVVERRGLQGLVTLLSDLLNCPVAVYDNHFRLLASYPESTTGSPCPWAELAERARAGEFLLRPIRSGRATVAHLVVWKPPVSLGQLDLIAIEHCATGIAFELVKQQERIEVERRYKYNFVFDLLENLLRSRETACTRAAALGCDLSNGGTILVANMDHTDEVFKRKLHGDESRLQALKEQILTLLEDLARQLCSGAIVTGVSDSFYVVLPATEGTQAKQRRAQVVDFAERLRRLVAERMPGLTVTVGIGQYYPDPLDLHKSFSEAKDAVRLGRALYGRNAVVPYENLGIYRLLTRAIQLAPEVFHSFTEETLGPLLAKERDPHAGRLLDTLRTFFDSGGNIRETARTLCVHPSTVKYRLHKISRILGIKLNTRANHQQLALHLAVRLLDVRPDTFSGRTGTRTQT